MIDTSPWTASRLRTLRTRLGWSRAELARFLRTDMAVVNMWESGAGRPNDEIGKALQVLLNNVESSSERTQRRPVAEVLMAESGQSQIHDSDVLARMESIQPAPLRSER